ncbi:hypothetical protein EG68_06551 [Paragonimus skrjabini miyazakii]|uniref:Amidase domain-containing protein n=1 Tax=Paragonimus skrjabini miyazakii TaxID=59628 RepID=A0A8S9YKV3_9TREM|nr:hypothetical protein EG68_06551 [Paragonimus skrjabini miyazakii]
MFLSFLSQLIAILTTAICQLDWSTKVKIIQTSVVLLLTFIGYRILNSLTKRRNLCAQLNAKQTALANGFNELERSLSTLSNHETEQLLKLTELSLSELRQKLTNKNVTPEQVLNAFQLKILRIRKLGNSGVAECIREANIWVKQISSQTASKLYGIPISLKECWCVNGYDSTMGLVKFCNRPQPEDCVLVKTLKQAGAIPFVLTATSQAARTMDGFNPIFGNMHNPYNSSCQPGGSSAGDAVLLAQHGTPLSIGSDLGGSVRIPAAFCGLVSLKPTTMRLSTRGMSTMTRHSVIHLNGCPGLIGHEVDDIADLMSTLLSPLMFHLDAYVPQIPFNEHAYLTASQRPLRIGFYDTLKHVDCVQTVPSIRWAVARTVSILKQAGHQLIDFTPENPSKVKELFLRAIFADGGCELLELLSNEPLGPALKIMHLALYQPKWMKRLTDWVMQRTSYRPLAVSRYLSGLGNASSAAALRFELNDYRIQFQQSWDRMGPLDALVCPVMAYPAPPTNMPSRFITPSMFYSFLFNVLDYPAGTVPVGNVTAEHVKQAMEMSKTDAVQNGGRYQREILKLQKDTEGLPLAVQVVAKPFQEELVLGVMHVIQDAQRH